MTRRFTQNLYRPRERFTYIGPLESHFAVDIIEDYLNKGGAEHSVTRIARSDFMSWTHYSEKNGIALFFSVSQYGKGRTRINLNVAICFLPEIDAEKAALCLLRMNSSINSPFRLAVLLLDIVALEYVVKGTFTTPDDLDSSLITLMDDALKLREKLLAMDLGFVAFPPSWFERQSAC